MKPKSYCTFFFYVSALEVTDFLSSRKSNLKKIKNTELHYKVRWLCFFNQKMLSILWHREAVFRLKCRLEFST